MTAAEQRRRLKAVLARLKKAHGRPERHHDDDPVGALVGTVLSQNTNAANSSAGYRSLVERFTDWDQVADAPTGEIRRCIRTAGLAATKAPRIRSILRRIRRDRGRIELGFLAGLHPRRAYEYLVGFEGVGPKTAWCVLLFAFDLDVFPVDTHIRRIAVRLGVLDDGASAERAHDVLTPLVAPGDRYDMHVLLIAHGRRTCLAGRPRCQRCCILVHCPAGQETLARQAQF